MKAMILAAGLGTRLRPLTEHRPKALVELCGTPLLEIVIRRLIQAGVDQVIINVHHLADMIVDYVRTHRGFGIRIEFSYEPVILGTGGGLQKAAWFLAGEEPFFLHNVDILFEMDLSDLLAFHRSHGAVASLAVQDRPTSRALVVDSSGRLCGRKGYPLAREPEGPVRWVGYNGVQVISPALLCLLSERPPFSIIDAEVRLCPEHPILAYDLGSTPWWDLGTKQALLAAEQAVLEGKLCRWWS
ncbi:MAG: nucleotidyltransferase family protein [bacterium]|jgi:NDP-sugar pyrophosphorylase family protein|nr:nucleotidyltransferase family protein [candidate division KSB1 bacterium]MDH7559486.1 nucleotidyltransferase family protein [bacterium]